MGMLSPHWGILGATAAQSTDLGEPAPLHGTWWDTHNFDNAASLSSDLQEEYRDAVELRLRGSPRLGAREGWTAQVAHPTATLNPPAWLSAARDHPVMAGQALILQPGALAAAGLPGTAAGALAAQASADQATLWASHATWIRNIKWAQHLKLVALPATQVVLATNETDNLSIGSSVAGVSAGELAVADFPAGSGTGQRMSADGIALALKRHVLAARASYEQMMAIDVPSGARTTPFPAVCAGPVSAFPGMTKPTAAQDAPQNASQVFDLTQLADTWNGEYLRWVHAVAAHNHRVHTRIESYDNVGPASHLNAMYHLWKFQERCMSYWPVSERVGRPLMITECATYWDSANGTWNGGTELIPSSTGQGKTWPPANVQNIKLREYRDAMQFCMMLWNGVIVEAKYATAHTGAKTTARWDSRPGDESLWLVADGGDGYRFKPLPDWAPLLDLRNHSNYDHGRNNLPATFAAKPWTDFAQAKSWAVWFDMNVAPTGTPLTTPPTIWWENVFFGTDGVADGTVEMRGWGSGTAANRRNMIMRPVWLAHPTRTHRFQVKVNFPISNASAKAKIRVRGHNKLNGLANIEAEVIGNDAAATGSNWKTIGVDFTHTGHGLLALKPVNYALLCCDHNAVGTVRWKDPEFLVS